MQAKSLFLKSGAIGLFACGIAAFIAYSSGWLQPEAPAASPAKTTLADTLHPRSDSILVYPDSKAMNTVINPFPGRAPEPDRFLILSSSKSALVNFSSLISPNALFYGPQQPEVYIPEQVDITR